MWNGICNNFEHLHFFDSFKPILSRYVIGNEFYENSIWSQ